MSDDTTEIARIVPPDPEGMNGARAQWAHVAIRQFQMETGTDLQDALCDLLGDLMHFADRHGFDFAHELQRGLDHYEAETMAIDAELQPEAPAEQPAPAEKLTMEAIERNPRNAVTLPLPAEASADLLSEVYFIASRLERDYFERYEDAETAEEATAHLDFAHAANARAHVAFDRLHQARDARLSVTLGTNATVEADMGVDEHEGQKPKLRFSL